MLDVSEIDPNRDQKIRSTTYDLVVIGAGIAGLNALYAAVQYLPRSARVLLIDQKARAGGMWNTAYDYVHLHQPHPMFTVGDMKWNWRQPRSYLASRAEVQAHLESALEPIARKVQLETRFEHTMQSCEEVETATGYLAEVSFHPNETPQSVTTIRAERAVVAYGLDYRLAKPLELSSGSVVSIIPQDLQATLRDHPDASVCVVGGGKTGMDTVLATLSENPHRSVTLIAGRGTHFMSRSKILPDGLGRWTSGVVFSRFMHDMATRFDGNNEEDLIRYFKNRYSTDASAQTGVFLFGAQSEDENDRAKAGLSDQIHDYLEDIEDSADGPVMCLRGGQRKAIADGTIVVNCTGSFFRTLSNVDMPCLSPNARVVSINARDGFFFLTSVSGFFLMHLLYRDKLRGQGFLTMDHEALFRANRNAWVGATVAQAYMAQTMAVQRLPLMLLDRCGLDLDRWYPLPRRMAALYKMKSNAERDIAHCRDVLHKASDRFGTRLAEIA